MKLLLLLGNGFEEIEALGTLDLLRRGNMEITTCTVNTTPRVLGAHGIVTEAEVVLAELDSSLYDGVILPGGMEGTQALAATQGVTDLLQTYDAAGKLICAICAASAMVLKPSGILRNRKVTGYPAKPLIEALGENYVSTEISIDQNLLTAAGPGSFIRFASAILTLAQGRPVALEVLRDALMA